MAFFYFFHFFFFFFFDFFWLDLTITMPSLEQWRKIVHYMRIVLSGVQSASISDIWFLLRLGIDAGAILFILLVRCNMIYIACNGNNNNSNSIYINWVWNFQPIHSQCVEWFSADSFELMNLHRMYHGMNHSERESTDYFKINCVFTSIVICD